MKVLESVSVIKEMRQSLLGEIGFVPTMGALHLGHLSLIEKSISENQITIVSIFVNPTQFDDQNDLNNYPQTIQDDIEKLSLLGVDYIFLPNQNEIYPLNYRYKISENNESLDLCGMNRKGHFDGVLTVVLKLFNLVKPHRAYFGKKDFQQFKLIKDMAQALFLDIEVIGVDTIRDENGLALSSRNKLLTKEQKEKASELNKVLLSESSINEKRNELVELGFGVEYIKQKWGRSFAAVKLGEIRLIDNVEI